MAAFRGWLRELLMRGSLYSVMLRGRACDEIQYPPITRVHSVRLCK